MPAKVVIGIMGPDKDLAKVEPLAEELGRAVAEAGWVVLTGGRSRGVMHAACAGAKRAGGMTIGVLPTETAADVSDAVDVAICTGIGSARNNINSLSSAVLVAIGMGPGTSAEVSLAIKNGKHVVLLAVSSEAAAFFASLAAPQVHIVDSVATAMTAIRSVLPQA